MSQDSAVERLPAADQPTPPDAEAIEVERLKKANAPSAQAQFDAAEYLELFYGDLDDTVPCMQVVLSYLPGIAARMEKGRCRTMIDVGSGPTVYVGFVFRNKVAELNFSDFSENNIRELVAFKQGLSRFKWGPVVQKIGLHEGASEHEMVLMEPETRLKINKIYKCDVFNPKVLMKYHPDSSQDDDGDPIPDQFDLVTSIFCLEYAGMTDDDYRQALTNVVGLLKPGGTLVLGGNLGDRCWSYNRKSYLCHTLTEEELFSRLQECGIDTETGFIYLTKADTYIVKGIKR